MNIGDANAIVMLDKIVEIQCLAKKFRLEAEKLKIENESLADDAHFALQFENYGKIEILNHCADRIDAILK